MTLTETERTERQRVLRTALRTPGSMVRNLAVERIARACHEVNGSYCQILGDDSHPPWGSAEPWARESVVAGVLKRLEDPDAPPSESHECWLEHKAATGWVYGELKDAEAKTHPCMVPYDELSTDQKLKDELFCRTCKMMFFCLGMLVSKDDTRRRRSADRPCEHRGERLSCGPRGHHWRKQPLDLTCTPESSDFSVKALAVAAANDPPMLWVCRHCTPAVWMEYIPRDDEPSIDLTAAWRAAVAV